MNLKYFFYREYFEGADLHQPTDVQQRNVLQKQNEAYFKSRNRTLTHIATPPLMRLIEPDAAEGLSWNALPRVRFGQADSEETASQGELELLELEVQNPGLLPGIGYPHETGYPAEFKLGLHFDHTSGLPVLTGSMIKGVLRSVWPQYAYPDSNPVTFKADENAEKAILQGKKERYIISLMGRIAGILPEAFKTPEDATRFVHCLELALFEGWDLDTLNTNKPSLCSMCKRAVFFDALPVAYSTANGKSRLLGADAITPHGADHLKNPKPLPFVKVMPGVKFAFLFRLFPLEIDGIIISAKHQVALFEAIFDKTGIGAKTNVGYGRLQKTAAEDVEPESDDNQRRSQKPELPPVRDSEYYTGRMYNGMKIKAQVLHPSDRKPGKTRITLLIKPPLQSNFYLNLDPAPEIGAIIQVTCQVNINGVISKVEKNQVNIN